VPQPPSIRGWALPAVDANSYCGIYWGRNATDQLHKAHHTTKLREAYAASAEAGLAITRQWEPLDAEAWARLEKKIPHRKGR
jgi:hypothetical protein